MTAEYKIDTVLDFLSVPEDRMPDCLTDFAEWVEFARYFPNSPEVKVSGFIWVDDGKRGLSEVRIHEVRAE